MVLDGGIALLAKPASGVGDGGCAARNEVAAWLVARLLGWSAMVAATVLRPLRSPTSGTDEEMALQVLWPGYDFTPDPSTFDDEEVWCAAIFDWLISHSDRVGNNWLGVPPAALPFTGAFSPHRQQLKLIDHGFAFDYPGRNAPASTFYEIKRGERAPDSCVERVEAFRQEAPNSSLAALIGDDPLQKLLQRADQLVADRTLPR